MKPGAKKTASSALGLMIYGGFFNVDANRQGYFNN
jgi:hypothetical protein